VKQLILLQLVLQWRHLILSVWFQHCGGGGERPRCPRGSDAFVRVIRLISCLVQAFKVGISGSAGRMALFSVQSNPRWWSRYREEPSDVPFCQTTYLALVY